MTTSETPRPIHEGRNVKRIREILGIKQEALASELGEDWTQKKISLLEAKEAIEPELLEQVASALKVPPESIKNFNEEAAINIINNTFNSSDNSTSIAYQSTFTFNPIDKIVQLYDEKIGLYERLLKEKGLEKPKIKKSKRK